MTDPLQDAFVEQAASCLALGSPFMAQLMSLLPELLPHAPRTLARLQAWEGPLGPKAASLPLRVAGGLHFLVRAGKAPDLAASYPPQTPRGLKTALAKSLAEHDVWLSDWIGNTPQTNEVGRSGVLIPAAMALSAHFGLPFRLSELGASAGLNLNFDRYGFQVANISAPATKAPVLSPKWTGQPPSLAPLFVQDREGVDLNPLDPQRDRDRLLAYVWPDQSERLDRLSKAIDIAAEYPVTVVKGDAAEWLQSRLQQTWEGTCHLVFHTVAHQYFPKQVQERIAGMMAQAGQRATLAAPLAWLSMEADDTPGSAAVTVRLWPSGKTHTLGRAGFHGQWVNWQGLDGS